MGDPGRSRRTVLLLGYVVPALVAVAGWALLVRAAIALGRDARDSGATADRARTVAATGGATVCALVAIVLLSRAWVGVTRTAPDVPRPGAHRR